MNDAGANGTDVMAMLSNGSNSFGTATNWRDLTWDWDGIMAVMGDLDADWDADFITLNDADANGTDVMAMLSNGSNGFGTPTNWRDLTTWGWDGIKPVMGDLDADRDADLMTLNNAAGAGTDVMAMLSNGSNGFGTPTNWRDLTWGWGGIKPFMGDADADGYADLGTVDEAGGAGTDIMMMLSNGEQWLRNPTTWRDLTWGWTGILVPL